MEEPTNYAKLIAPLLILGVAVWLALEIPRGILTNSDELFTAERSREMLLLGPWQVHLNFQPSYSKPPLQYWLTALTLSIAKAHSFLSREVAVRIWPLIFGILTAIALVWLARLIEDSSARRNVLAILSVAALVSCPLFTTEISRALLDSGLMFFTTIAILFAHLARKRPVWWLGVAIVCWLGTLQKIPFIFLIWGVIVLVRLISPAERAALRSKWLIAGFVLAIALAAIWPSLQLLKYHARLDEVLGVGEFASLIHNISDRPYLEIPFRMSTSWLGGGSLALLAPVILFFRKAKQPAITELSIVCLGVTLLAIVSNARSMRYLVPIIPCFCLLLAATLQWTFGQSHRVRMIAMIVGCLFFTIDLVEAKLMINFRRKDAADQQGLAEELGALQQPGIKIGLIRGSDHNSVLFPPFYLFYGNLRFPITTLTIEDFGSNRPPPPIIGVCTAADFESVRQKSSSSSIEAQRGQFICWRVED